MRRPDLRFIRRDIKQAASNVKSATFKRHKFPALLTLICAAGAAGCAAFCIALLDRSSGIRGFVSDGRHAFSAGALVHEQALFGILVSALSFVAIMTGHLLSKHMRIRAATFSAAFVMMSGLCLALTISSYHQFG